MVRFSLVGVPWVRGGWRFSLAAGLMSGLVAVASLQAEEPPAKEGPKQEAPKQVAPEKKEAPKKEASAKEVPAKEAPANEVPRKERQGKREKSAKEEKPAAGASATADKSKETPPKKKDLELSELAAAKVWPGLCLYEYPISTRNPQVQALFNQGLGYLYSYVWIEAARSFETAAKLEPENPMCWWGLGRALQQWGRTTQATKALTKAKDHLKNASGREKALIRSMLQEKGMEAGVGDSEARKKVAIATIDELLIEYPDDQEAWWARGQLAGNFSLFGGNKSSAPFYHALLRINPIHPGASHELTHFYEQVRRPALGMAYADKYIESTPGIAHPFHMQAHLATRIGRWDKTADRSKKAIDIQKAYHRDVGVTPKEDQQYSHHLEILFISLTHDGRFAEARGIMEDARKAEYEHFVPWVRFAMASGDFELGAKLFEDTKRKDKNLSPYVGAWLALEQGRMADAAAQIEALRQAVAAHPKDTRLALRLWEMQGWQFCMEGDIEPGLALIKRCVDKTKDDFNHHAWGQGATLMERWGQCALEGNKLAEAEEAFLEALAHDPGSVIGALGLEEICRRQGRQGEMVRYRDLANKNWVRAQPSDLAKLRQKIGAAGPSKLAKK